MKGIVVLDEIPKSCVDCPMCYHAEDMSLGQFKYERLYRCKLEPEEVEQVYLDDILHKKPDWCPIKSTEEIKNYKNYTLLVDEHFRMGWNYCLDVITNKKGESK